LIEITRVIVLICLGLLNLYPAIGVLSAGQIEGLYGIDVVSTDLEILMRHRAVMLGLVGGLLLVSAFRPRLQVVAATVGFISMSSFVAIAYLAGEFGPRISTVVLADIVGSIAAAFVLISCLFKQVKRLRRGERQ